MTKVTPTSNRKADHIRINLEQDVQSGLTTGLERLHFEHCALPELDLADVSLQTTFLNMTLSAPILISSMTGGTEEALSINHHLAEAAQEMGIPIGLGSQRAAIDHPEIESSFKIRSTAKDVPILANLGAVQLNYGYGIDECRRAVEMVAADALILHLNPLQEALQPEGDTNFKGLLVKIEAICSQLEVPVIAKEVGWGLSAEVSRRLVSAGVQAIDVAGAGGTSWSQVEMFRAQDEMQAQRAAQFVGWGIPTARAVLQVRDALPEIPLIASGGLRSGIDVAKCIALGADLCGMAGPLLKAAVQSSHAVVELLERIALELKICMLSTGSVDIEALKKTRLRGEG